MDRPQRPLFRRRKGRVDEGFTEIDFAAISQILGESLQQPVEPSGALPELEPAMTGLIGRIASGQIRPRGPSAEHPEYGVHDATRIGPGPAAPVRPPARTEDRFEHGPLLVGKVHAVEYDGDGNFVPRPPMGFMR